MSRGTKFLRALIFFTGREETRSSRNKNIPAIFFPQKLLNISHRPNVHQSVLSYYGCFRDYYQNNQQ